MIIAVDFDGTIVTHEYPHIGKEIPFAVKTLKMLQQEGHVIILWSCRTDKLLRNAVEWCSDRGLEFTAINKNYAEETTMSRDYCRKLKADLYIDDRGIGGLPSWGEIYKIIHEKKTFRQLLTEHHDKDHKKHKKKHWWQI
ncbi:MAG: hypothetical protein HUK08_09790 [Bacteroidaceae bacterium]|nr:hypothetical protein [Bacteroidaceae bacterium]